MTRKIVRLSRSQLQGQATKVMATPPPNVVEIYNHETCECVLAEDYKCKIRKALPKGIEPPEAFWRELADVVSKFHVLGKCRTERRSTAEEIKRYKKIIELTTPTDPTPALTEIKTRAERHLGGRGLQREKESQPRGFVYVDS